MYDFYFMYRRAGFFQKTLAEYLGVTPKTVGNWEKTNRPPVAVIKLLQLVANDLSHLGEGWTGFRFIAGELVTPENEFVSPGKVRAHRFLNMTIDFMGKENLKLKQEVQRLKSPNSYFAQRKTFPA